MHDIDATLRAIAFALYRIESKVNRLIHEEDHMADALQEAFDALAAEVNNDVAAVDASVISELQSLAAQVAAIQPGTTVTPEQVTALAQTLQTATAQVKAAATAAQPAPATPPVDQPPATPPVDQPPADQPPATVVPGQDGTPTAVPADQVPADVTPAGEQPSTEAPADPAQVPANTEVTAS